MVWKSNQQGTEIDEPRTTPTIGSSLGNLVVVGQKQRSFQTHSKGSQYIQKTTFQPFTPNTTCSLSRGQTSLSGSRIVHKGQCVKVIASIGKAQTQDYSSRRYLVGGTSCGKLQALVPSIGNGFGWSKSDSYTTIGTSTCHATRNSNHSS